MPVRFSFSPGKPGKSRKPSAPAASVERIQRGGVPEAFPRIEAAFLSSVAYRRPVEDPGDALIELQTDHRSELSLASLFLSRSTVSYK
jgi:hypothetical protein